VWLIRVELFLIFGSDFELEGAALFAVWAKGACFDVASEVSRVFVLGTTHEEPSSVANDAGRKNPHPETPHPRLRRQPAPKIQNPEETKSKAVAPADPSY